jgi:transglutaminase-like putative cysteine protease
MRLPARSAGARTSPNPGPGMRACGLLFCSLILLLQAAQGQTPPTSPAGNPAVNRDTIYRLAISRDDDPADDAVVLLDDAAVRYETDGTGVETYRQVIQILKPEAVEGYAEHEFSYSPTHQRLTVNWIRVVRPDGSLVSEAPSQVQDADVPAALTDPIYADTKIRRYSLSGVAPGTIVDWSYTLEELKPFLPGDFFQSWSVQSGRLTRRLRVLVDLPTAMRPHVIEHNLTFRHRETESRGRRTYLWATEDAPRVQPEEFMADSNGVIGTIGVSGWVEWEDIGRWYSELSEARYALNHSTRDRIRSVVRSAATADDSLRALHRYVAQDIRYVSIALGLGGYQPRKPSEVLTSGYGDCKDKATLFIAAARALGFRAYPVLLNAGQKVERGLPSLQQFNHAIAVVERSEGRVYLDPTAYLVPYGELPESEQGQFGLVVYPDGTSEQVTLPQAGPGDNLNQTLISGVLTPDGYVTAWYQERGLGSRQLGIRSLFVSPMDSIGRADFARSTASKVFPGAEADSLEIFDGRDLLAEPRVALKIVHGFAARPAGSAGTMVLTLPFPSMRGMADAAAMLESRQPRRFPVDAAKVIGPATTETELRLALPSGWAVQLPPSIEAVGRWGSYAARYSQHGDTLLVSRRLQGSRGVYPPESIADLAEWLRAIGQDDVPHLALQSKATP